MGRAFPAPLLLILLIINPWSTKKLTSNDADLLALFAAYIKGRYFLIQAGLIQDRFRLVPGRAWMPSDWG